VAGAWLALPRPSKCTVRLNDYILDPSNMSWGFCQRLSRRAGIVEDHTRPQRPRYAIG
jgi:hypothetical protein